MTKWFIKEDLNDFYLFHDHDIIQICVTDFETLICPLCKELIPEHIGIQAKLLPVYSSAENYEQIYFQINGSKWCYFKIKEKSFYTPIILPKQLGTAIYKVFTEYGYEVG